MEIMHNAEIKAHVERYLSATKAHHIKTKTKAKKRQTVCHKRRQISHVSVVNRPASCAGGLFTDTIVCYISFHAGNVVPAVDYGHRTQFGQLSSSDQSR